MEPLALVVWELLEDLGGLGFYCAGCLVAGRWRGGVVSVIVGVVGTGMGLIVTVERNEQNRERVKKHERDSKHTPSHQSAHSPVSRAPPEMTRAGHPDSPSSFQGPSCLVYRDAYFQS